MSKSLAELKKSLATVKPWGMVAAALTVGLLAYYGFEGWQFWESTQEAQSLKIQKVVLDRTIREGLRGQEMLGAARDAQRVDMQMLEQVFHHPQTDDLIGAVADAARRRQVTLSSVSTGAQSTLTRDEMQYQVQPMSIILEGQEQDVYRFFATLQQSMPTVRLESVRLSGGGDVPTLANVQLSFRLSPQAVEKKAPVPKGKAPSSKSNDPVGVLNPK
jgi:hypothetical protein